MSLKNIPAHLAIIMDGNGRWAKRRNLPRISGHIEGIRALKSVIKAVMNYGIKYLTVYAFSSENWQRPQDEVDSLMELLYEYINAELPYLLKNKIKLGFIGNLERVPEHSRKTLLEAVDRTKNLDGLTLTLALSYGAREEILNASAAMATDFKEGRISLENLDEGVFSSYLYTGEMPDPDLLIRTSGEERLSNFLLYQLAYTEIYFTRTLWPDFRKKNLDAALKNYDKRTRRFGKTEV